MNFNGELVAAMAMFAFVTSVTPGPNNMMLLASGVNFGVKRTVPHWLGVSLGHFVMLLLVGAGLESLLKAYPFVYQVMKVCLLYTSPSPRDRQKSRMPSSA